MQDILTHQQSRVNLYAFISRLLLMELDEDLLEIIQNDENMMVYLPNFSKWEKREKLSNKELIEQYLNVDFTNLFLLHAIPYESFYTREDQMMETGGENPVLQFFNKYDFRVDLSIARAVSVDHIGIEAEFMYKLSQAQLDALKEKDIDAACEIAKIQKEFLEKHLLNFAPMYLINLKGEARTPFYFDVADLALEFLLDDYEFLSKLITEKGCNYNL